MKIDTKIDFEKGTAIHTLSGDFSLKEIVNTMDRFWSIEKLPDKIHVIWDARGTNFRPLSPRDFQHLADETQMRNGIMKKGRTALVVSQEADYGLLRMFEAYLGDITREVKIFRDFKDAFTWIQDI